jgi:hypothetical protein
VIVLTVPVVSAAFPADIARVVEAQFRSERLSQPVVSGVVAALESCTGVRRWAPFAHMCTTCSAVLEARPGRDGGLRDDRGKTVVGWGDVLPQTLTTTEGMPLRVAMAGYRRRSR